MAKITDGTLRDWKNGDVVSSDAYEQDREVLKVAINDADDKVEQAKVDITALEKRADDLEYNVTGTVVPMTFKELGMQNLTFDDIKLGYIDNKFDHLVEEGLIDYSSGITEELTATAGQTVFTPSNVIGDKQFTVMVDGIPQSSTSYTYDSALNKITFVEGLIAGQLVTISIGSVRATADSRVDTLKNTLGGIWLDVKSDFSAVGDGVVDDTVDLQAAFEYAKTNGSVRLYFPKGTFTVSSYIQLYSNTTVLFHPEAVIKRIGTTNKVFMNGESGNSTFATGYNGAGNIHFIGGTIDLNNTTLDPNTTMSCLDLGHGENISFTGLTVKNGQIGHYFQVTGCNRVTFRDCTFRDQLFTGTGTSKSYEVIQMEPISAKAFPSFGSYDDTITKNVTIDNCRFINVIRALGNHSFISKVTTTGSVMTGTTALTVADASKFNTGESIKVIGAAADSNGNPTDLTTTISLISGTTLTLAVAASFTVSGANVSNQADINIPAQYSENIRIINNTILSSNDNSINLYAFKNSVIKNNYVENAGAYGIYLKASVDNTFGDNRVVSSQKAGMHFDYSHRNRIKGTLLREVALSNSYSAFRLIGSTDNIFDDNSVLSDVPNFSYAFFTSDGCSGTKLRNYNFNKGKSGTISGEFTLSNNLTWVSVGTSITRGNNSGNGYYQDYALPMMPKVVKHYNRGYGGYCVAIPGTPGAYDSINSVVSDIEVADIYTIEFMTNEFSRDIPVGSTADATGLVDSYWGGLKQLYIDLTTKNMNALIVCITDPKRIIVSGNSSSKDWNTPNGAGFKLTDYANAFKEFAAQYGLPVIDWFTESGVSARTAPTWLYDGLHPTLETNKRLGKMVANKINLYI